MIRIVEKNDEKYIEDIINLEKGIFGENGAIDLWNLKPYIKYGKVFVYLVQNEVVAVAELMRAWSGDKAYLYGICVDGNFRGQGIGKKLIENICEYLKAQGVKLIELTVAPENKEAIALYEKLGFEKEEFLENEYGENKHRYLYVKKIF